MQFTVMNKINFHPNIWASVPYTSHTLSDWYRHNELVRDFVLLNTELKRLGVSKMDLTITKISLIDQEGNEMDVETPSTLEPLQTSAFVNGSTIKLSDLNKLKPGSYTHLRLCLSKTEKGFTYSNGNKESVNARHHLDFQIENNLEIGKDCNYQVNFWFQLTPFHFGRNLKPIMDVFKRLKSQRPRFVGTMGS